MLTFNLTLKKAEAVATDHD